MLLCSRLKHFFIMNVCQRCWVYPKSKERGHMCRQCFFNDEEWIWTNNLHIQYERGRTLSKPERRKSVQVRSQQCDCLRRCWSFGLVSVHFEERKNNFKINPLLQFIWKRTLVRIDRLRMRKCYQPSRRWRPQRPTTKPLHINNCKFY